MNPLACQTCAARVDVAKYSPAHTSIQWNPAAAAACHEKAAADAVGGYLLRCTRLDEAINDAVRRGDVALSLRTDPAVVPLTAGQAVPPSDVA